jgi:alpha-tubulin suppressor-like RCC1 family protein
VAACVGDAPVAATGSDASTDTSVSGSGDAAVDTQGAADTASPQESGGDAADAGCIIAPSSIVLNDATQLALGSNNGCAIRANGSVVCWGDNAYGQLGVSPGSTPSSFKPVTVAFPSSVQIIKIGAGDLTAFALDSNHQLWAWGSNQVGLLGNGAVDSNTHAVPAVVDVASTPNIVYDFAVAGADVCAVTGGGYIKCWGSNQFQELGPNAPDGGSNTPVPAFSNPFSTTNVQIYSGFGATDTCLTSSTGDTWCWGANLINGVAGPGAQGSSNTSMGTELTGAGAALPISQFDIGTNFGCALDANHAVLCWGYNSSDQLTPAGIPKLTGDAGPGKVSGIQPTRLATGYVHVCVLDGAEHVQCWGDNAHQQLGRGTSGGTGTAPVAVVGLDGGGTLGSVVGLASGQFFSCAILQGACGVAGPGSVVCWGENGNEQLGTDAGATSPVPVPVFAP